MDSGNHAFQGIEVSNKIQTFLLVRVLLKYRKWQGTMASGSNIWDVK